MFICYYPTKQKKTIPECLNCSAKKQTPNLIAYLQILKKTALNAFSKKIPDANISCCYFHLTQSFNRKIKEIGPKVFFENCPDFNLALRMLPALAHVPPCHVKASFELVVEKIAEVIGKETFDDTISEKLDELALYFKNTYIDCPTVTQKAPFPKELWNQFEAAGEGVARKTNSVEGWHYGLQASFTGSQPNVWLLLRNLEKDSKMQKFKYLQETTGIVCSKRLRYEKTKKNRCKSYKVATLSRTSCLICEQSPTLDENNELFCCIDLLLF